MREKKILFQQYHTWHGKGENYKGLFKKWRNFITQVLEERVHPK